MVSYDRVGRQYVMRTTTDVMSQHQVRKSGFWLEFFHLYRSMPELWLTNSPEYRNRKLKAASYERLLQHMRQADPSSNIHMLKRKINNLRTSYRRELRKVLESKGGGGHGEGDHHEEEEEYVPALWYYGELDFLYEQETGEAQTLLPTPASRLEHGQEEMRQTDEANTHSTLCMNTFKEGGLLGRGIRNHSLFTHKISTVCCVQLQYSFTSMLYSNK